MVRDMRVRAARMVAISLVVCAAAVSLPVAPAFAQRDRGRGGDGGYSQDRRGDSRSDRGRRDDLRSEWTRSSEGRRFDNGITLRRAEPIRDSRWDRYFPTHYYSYPYYAPSRGTGVDVAISPYGFYLGLFPTYIERRHVFLSPPPAIFIDVPIYTGRSHRSDRGGSDDYYLNRGSRREDTRWLDDPEVKHAVYDLEDAFRNDDIALLTGLTDPHEKVAIFAKGHFEYSLEPNDYLDMTRDFMRTAHTANFSAYRVHYRSNGVYQVFARHDYRDSEGQTRSMYLCFALERTDGRWIITQVDSSPNRMD